MNQIRIEPCILYSKDATILPLLQDKQWKMGQVEEKKKIQKKKEEEEKKKEEKKKKKRPRTPPL